MFMFSIVLLGSCDKEGCTDPIAYNYDSSASRDDGSCLLYVPDDNFELYLETHTNEGDSVNVGDINSLGDGINNNNFVLLNRVKFLVDSLSLRYQSASNSNTLNGIGITDLTGLRGFVNLVYFDGAFNPISSANFSGNYFLNSISLSGCTSLSTLDVQSNLQLEHLQIHNCDISDLDISNNVSLTQLTCSGNNISALNTANNVNLEVLECHNNQQLNSLDLTSNVNLRSLASHNCQNLNSIDLRNGANNLIFAFLVQNTPNLNCIAVDDSSYSNDNWIGNLYCSFDSQHYFSNFCP